MILALMFIFEKHFRFVFASDTHLIQLLCLYLANISC